MTKKKSANSDDAESFKSSIENVLNEECSDSVNTRKRGRKPNKPEETNQYYNRTEKVFNTSGTTHTIFINVNENQKVTSDTSVGIRVLVARYPDFYKIYLYDYHNPGEPSYPHGGVRVWNEAFGQIQAFYYDSVAIHPEGGSKRFHKQVDNSMEVVDNENTTDENKEI